MNQRVLMNTTSTPKMLDTSCRLLLSSIKPYRPFKDIFSATYRIISEPVRIK